MITYFVWKEKAGVVARFIGFLGVVARFIGLLDVVARFIGLQGIFG